MSTTDLPPMRPRGAARHAAAAPTETFPTRRARRAAEIAASNAGGHAATGAAASSPAASVSTAAVPTPRRSEPEPPPRRSVPGPGTRRSTHEPTVSLAATDGAGATRASRPAGASVTRSVTQALTLPLRTLGQAVASARAVPVTATAVAACLFVTVATPQSAMASTPLESLPALDGQEYTAAPGSSVVVHRDGFAIGRVPIRVPGSPPPVNGDGPASVRPVAGSIPTAGGFGSRWVRGCAACSTNHQGLDFAAPTGTPVLAAMSGRVVSAGRLGGYGNQILLQHADGSQTRYGHLSQIGVRVGQSVSVGERIGAVGSTGVSTGSHLHFEVILGGVPVDPAVWLGHRGLL